MPPPMLVPEELRFLVWLTQSVFEGWGAVVDLGPWLGSSTCALAEGLRRKGRRERIRAFDNFVWRRDYMERHYPADLPDHADFRFLFERFTRPYADLVEAHTVDLHTYRWNGGPIEILFVDAAKDWELTNNILASFGRALVPGKSLVVLQDYQHWSTYFLPLVFGSRPDLWEGVHMTEDGYTATFRTRRPLEGPGGIERYSRASFPYEKAAPLLRGIAEERSGRNRLTLLGCLLRLMHIEGRKEEAARLREQIERDPEASRVLPSLAGVDETLYEDLERGWGERAAGRSEKALEIARSGLARRPGEPYFRTLLAWSLGSLGRWEEAEREIDALVREAPTFLEGWLNRAKMHLERGRPKDARADAERARALAGGEANLPTDYFEVVAQGRIREGDAAGALAALERLVERRPGDARPLLWRARALRLAGRPREALADAREALRLEPSNEEVAREVRALEGDAGVAGR